MRLHFVFEEHRKFSSVTLNMHRAFTYIFPPQMCLYLYFATPAYTLHIYFKKMPHASWRKVSSEIGVALNSTIKVFNRRFISCLVNIFYPIDISSRQFQFHFDIKIIVTCLHF